MTAPDRLEQQLADFERVLDRLNQALALPPSDVARDSAILRFELAFELSWKVIQRAASNQGFTVNSPRQAFERAFTLGWITDEVLWSAILTSRNLAVHIYREPLADELHRALPQYQQAFRQLLNNIKNTTQLPLTSVLRRPSSVVRPNSEL